MKSPPARLKPNFRLPAPHFLLASGGYFVTGEAERDIVNDEMKTLASDDNRENLTTLPTTGDRTVLHFILIFIALAVGILTIGYGYYRNHEQSFLAEEERQLSTIADLKVGELAQWRRERLADGSLLFRNAPFSALIRRFLEQPEDADAPRQLRVWFEKYGTCFRHDEVRLLDAQCVTRLSWPAGLLAVTPEVAEHASEAHLAGQVMLQDFYRSTHDQQVRLAILIPIIDEADGSRPLGTIILRIDPAKYLYPLIQGWPTPSKTAETLLVRREGNDVVYLNELRHQANAARALRVPLTRTEVPAVQAALGQTGNMSGIDYRGVPVHAVGRAVPDSPWILIAKMDSAEVYAPLHAQLWQVIVMIGVLLFGAGTGLGWVWWQQRVRHLKLQMAAAETLRESEKQYRELFESASDALLLLASDTGQVLDANNMASVLYGYDRAELLTRKNTDLSAEPEETTRRTQETISEPGRVFNIPMRLHRKKDGTVFPVEITARSFLRKGEPVLLVACRDITERKRAEEAHEKLKEQFAQAQKMESVGRLAGGVAHDFNNMMMGVLGYADFCRDSLPAEHPMRSDLDEITKCANRSAELTRQLLAFARKQIIQPKVLDLNDALSGVLNLLQKLIGADIKVVWMPGANLPPVKLDPYQVDQILTNLFINSRDAIGGVGKITVATSSATLDRAFCDDHPGATPGEYVLLRVSDTGCGMTKEVMASLFEPFFTTKDIGKGTGLGLATVHGIVMQNHGIIDVSSEPDKGATFRIYLPVYSEEIDKTSVASSGEVPRGRGETILFVDDEPSLVKTCGRYLVSLGYKVLLAATPAEALVVLSGHPGPIHLLFTDVIMPDMNGRDLAKHIQASNPGLKVLYMSGYAREVIAGKGVLDETMHFLQKPSSPDVMARKVREVLDDPGSFMLP